MKDTNKNLERKLTAVRLVAHFTIIYGLILSITKTQITNIHVAIIVIGTLITFVGHVLIYANRKKLRQRK